MEQKLQLNLRTVVAYPLKLPTALDHMRALGGTVIEIGRKKAGVFKRGRPCLVGPQVPLAVMQVRVSYIDLQFCLCITIMLYVCLFLKVHLVVWKVAPPIVIASLCFCSRD